MADHMQKAFQNHSLSWRLIKIALKFVSNGPNDNKSNVWLLQIYKATEMFYDMSGPFCQSGITLIPAWISDYSITKFRMK